MNHLRKPEVELDAESDKKWLLPPPDAVSIFVLGLLGLVLGIPAIAAYIMGRIYKEKLLQGRVRRSRLADAGLILATISLIIFLAVVALMLLALIGVIGLSQLLAQLAYPY